MSRAPAGFFGIALALLVLSSGCSALSDYWTRQETTESGVQYEAARSDAFGPQNEVQTTVAMVKGSGDREELSSRAIRLPNRSLGSITSYDYRLPQHCGGHHFRVFETDGTQILEFEHHSEHGEISHIRDYVTGPSPFINAGLWTAYDHTAGGVSDMTVKVGTRGSRLLAGTYSQGPVSGLNESDRRQLGEAYLRALRDAYKCDMQSAVMPDGG